MIIGAKDVSQTVPEQIAFSQSKLQEGALSSIRKEINKEMVQEANKSEQRISSEELSKLMEEIKRKFDMLSKYLRIDIDSDLEIPVAKIIEKDTNKIIRQIPPEYLLDLMKKIDQTLGILLEREV
ncbi:MAG: flagellar protein FlaG [Aquificaceae bacterium]